MEESFEKKCLKIKIEEEKIKKEEIESKAKAFCYKTKTSTEAFIELLENLNYEDRLTKIKSLNKRDLEKVEKIDDKVVRLTKVE